jgi:hypothetical protein
VSTSPLAIALYCAALSLVVAALLAGRHMLGRGLLALARAVGRAWHRATGRRRPQAGPRAALARAEWRPARTSPRDLLASIRREAASVMTENAFIPLVAAGDARSRWSLAEFAGQQAQLLASDRRSYLHLAARFASAPAGTFFAELADTARQAREMLAASGAGARGAGPQPCEQLPGCQAYPSFVSWLALNSTAEDAALAVAVSLDLWGRNFAAMARALRDAPGFADGDRASAFFDIFAVPGSHIEDQAVAVAQEAQDDGRKPARAREYARTLAAYQSMWWTALADRAPAGNRLA